MTHRVRAKAFSCLLRQEMAYFDRKENNSSSICNRLLFEALAIQQMTGTRLGIVCEVATMIVFVLIVGPIFSWQIALIVLAFVVFGFICSYTYIVQKSRSDEKCRLLSDQAALVRSNSY